MLLTGAEILLKCLLEQKVDTIFGFPGGTVLNIYDELYKYSDKINHILVAHEQGAAHAADGYARSTGKVGVCLATSGPGATNLVTGIATAYMDSIPIVAITGNVALPLLGKDSFQEVDITGVTMPITKHNYIVKKIEDLAKVVREAFYIARSGRPGPVLIDIPKDITAAKTDYVEEEPITTEYTVNIDSIKDAAKLINSSKCPMIFSGGGVISSEASEELIKLAEKINAPVATSTMGIGAFPSSHRLYTGMIGMHGTKASNLTALKSDLLIAIGVRFSDRVISKAEHFQEKTKILHIDIDYAEIGKNVKVHSFVIGDVKTVLKELIPLIDEKKNEAWEDEVEKLKSSNTRTNGEFNNYIIKPNYFFEKLHEVTKGEAIICTDVGQHQMWTAQFYHFEKPRTLISSLGLGAMGYGVGASVGVQIANPDKRVVTITGDGSFGMNCTELATIVSNNLPIVIIVMDNNSLGMVRQWQSLFYEGRASHTILNRKTDFVKLAEAFGAKGLRINDRSEVETVLKQAIDLKEPVVIDCMIEGEEKVFPMVAPGNPINKIITEDDI
ncbi:MAG: biosynthetic-type acetolactate synthase large subunit [Oscillospiraceae bacterium]|nr:biosynthetic-type acetolactate synthase large subunit [Oscillospiraceae bacterium]